VALLLIWEKHLKRVSELSEIGGNEVESKRGNLLLETPKGLCRKVKIGRGE